MNTHKSRRINIVVIVATIVLSIAQVFILNYNSTSGEKLRSVNIKIAEINDDNNRLVQEIASASAIATIAIKAQEIGFAPNISVLSLNSPLPIALSKHTAF
jgi:hypothetical protein